jgi:5-formyltetrahydrofolate cyclo-ligase
LLLRSRATVRTGICGWRPLNSSAGATLAPLAGEALAQRDALRRELRARRRALDPAARVVATGAITRHIAAARWLHGARPIGLYVSVGLEVDTEALRLLARRRRCPVYLPRISNYRQCAMLFARDHGQLSLLNRHGIPESAAAETMPARSLSVVFMPLLGFDDAGTRLGSGAGYYDRLFAFRRRRHSWHRPLLVGLAFACQHVRHIEPGRHDVPLDAVVTEHGVQYF